MNSSSNSDPKDAYAYFDKSPMFKLSLSSKELFHSNFLDYLCNVDAPAKDAFKGLIEKMAGLKEYEWPEKWFVKREYHNFDICIVEGEEKDSDEEKDSNEDQNPEADKTNEENNETWDCRILFVIENKVKSIPYAEQLRRYTQEAEEQNWRFFSRMAKGELDNAKTVFRVEEKGPWYKRDDNGWFRWEKQNRRWGKIDKPGDKPIETGKTGFYNEYVLERMESCPIHFILLSLAEDFPDKPQNTPDSTHTNWPFDNVVLFPDKKKEENGGNNRTINRAWSIIRYSDYVNWIRESFHITSNDSIECDDSDKLNKMVIDDYCAFAEKLTSLVNSWSSIYKNSRENYLYFEWEIDKKGNYKRTNENPDFVKARKYRIHDLYQKIRYSYLCGVLYDRIKQSVNDKKGESIKVFPSNQGGLFKPGQDGKRKGVAFICVNQVYLHGEPLLEVNIHPAFNEEDGREICYAIQVQGGVYEHGFQVRKWVKGKVETIKAADVWKEFDDLNKRKEIDSFYKNANEWIRLPRVEDADTEWKNDDDCFYSGILPKGERSQDMNPKTDNKGNTTYPGYNKYDLYDSTYIYQSRRIKNKATIEAIINRMCQDTLQVVDWL